MERFLKILRLIGIPFIIAAGIYTFIRFVWLENYSKEFSFENINTEEYLKLYYDSKESVVFIVKDDTENKSEYEETIREKFDGKNISVYYYNISNLTGTDLTEFETITDLSNGKYELPILIYTLNGEVYDTLEGCKEGHYVQDFIERNNIK